MISFCLLHCTVSEMEPETTNMFVIHTTSEPLPLSTTEATGQAPSAPPAAEPSSPPVPEMENESGMGLDREIELEAERKQEEKEREQEIEDEIKSVREKEKLSKLDKERELEREQERERERERELELEKEREHERQRDRVRTTGAPRFHLVPEMTTDSSQILSETVQPIDNMENLSTINDDLKFFITPETYPINPFSTDISTTEVPPTIVASVTEKNILNPTPSISPRRRKPHPTPTVGPHRPQKPHVIPSQVTPTEIITLSMTSTSQVIQCIGTQGYKIKMFRILI